jgi:hypothetical protein
LIATVIERSGASLRGVEVRLTGTLGATRVAGRADVVLDAPSHVIDLKWGMSSHREQLRAGAVVQLAVYAALLGRGSGAGFVVLRDVRVLATRGSGLPMAAEPGDHTIEDVIVGVGASLEVRVEELARGRLVAPGALEDAPRSRLVDGVLRLAPRCEYCDVAAMCGRRGRT